MPLRCLIIDDSTPYLEAARDALERQGVKVVGVGSTSAEALQRVAELQPDVTLVDVDLGAESGFDVARRLADAEGLDQSRVVLISSYAEKDFAELIARSPAAGFVSKADLSRSAIYDILRSGDNRR